MVDNRISARLTGTRFLPSVNGIVCGQFVRRFIKNFSTTLDFSPPQLLFSMKNHPDTRKTKFRARSGYNIDNPISCGKGRVKVAMTTVSMETWPHTPRRKACLEGVRFS